MASRAVVSRAVVSGAIVRRAIALGCDSASPRQGTSTHRRLPLGSPQTSALLVSGLVAAGDMDLALDSPTSVALDSPTSSDPASVERF